MLNKISQNIFDYATSELSQDAFISLLIAWFDSEEEELRDISKNFISSLYSKYFSKFEYSTKKEELIFTENDSIKIDEKQYYKIDVYFELMNDGEKIPFIIEDKTWTEPHSDQLSRYVQKVSKLKEYPKKENEESKKIVKIFFKTGHITEKDEAETEISKYIIINTKWIYDFLNQYDIDNIIFNNYKEYLLKKFYEKLYHNDQKKELKDWDFTDVYNGYVQYSIIKEIKNKLIVNTLFNHDSYIRFTRNGTSWDTWWSFYSNGFSLFVKIKRIGTFNRIRLIKYSQSKVASVDKQSNLEKFSLYIDDYLKLNNHTSVKKTRKPRYKAREIEIAFLELDSKMTLENSVKEFSHFMGFFIKKIINNETVNI